MSIGERIKEIRMSYNLTLRDFAEKIGITPSSASKLENGANNPAERTVLLICSKFRVNENWLRNGEGEMQEPLHTEQELSDLFARCLIEKSELRNIWMSIVMRATPEELQVITNMANKLVSELNNSGSPQK